MSPLLRLGLAAGLACAAALSLPACRTRELESLPFLGPPDFSTVVDLAVPPDLIIPPDFLPPPDLTRPVYCNGIYVFQSDDKLAFYNPLDGTLTDLGTIGCQRGASPFSMGVGKDGIAWVEYSPQPSTLFRYDTRSMKCVPTAFVNPGEPFSNFGMGFAADGPGSAAETLYLAGSADSGGATPTLGRLDLQTLAITPIGQLSGRAELTGTGGGELWAFFADANPRMQRLDKQSGAVLADVTLPGLGDLSNSAFAFAAWGGDFYAFVTGGPGGSPSQTSVWRIHEVDGKLAELKRVGPTIGRVIVGAGVSTCAPLGLDQ